MEPSTPTRTLTQPSVKRLIHLQSNEFDIAYIYNDKDVLKQAP